MPKGPLVVLMSEALGADAWHGLRALGAGRALEPATAEVSALLAEERLTDEPPVSWLVDDATSRQGSFTDFFTGRDRHKVRVHLFGMVSNASPHGRLDDLLRLVDAVAYHDLPIVVHAVLDGVHMEAKSAWPLVEELEDALERCHGRIGTICGQGWAMDRLGRWDRALAVYRAVVRGDVDVMPSAHAAIEAAYRAGAADAEVAPVRLGDYEGLVGDLTCEYPGGSWAFRGDEVGILAGRRPDSFSELAALFRRRGLPDDVSSKLSLRGRPMFAFDDGRLVSFVPLEPALEIRSVAKEDDAPRGLLEALVGARRPVAIVAEASARALVEQLVPVSAEGVTVDLVGPSAVVPGDAGLEGPPPEVPMEVVFAVMEAAVARGEPPPGSVGAGEAGEEDAPLPAPTPASPAEVAAQVVAALGRGPEAVVFGWMGAAEHPAHEEALASVERAVIAAEGQLLTVGFGAPGDAGGGAPSLSLRGGGAGLAQGSLVDVAPTVLALAGLDAPPAMTGTSLLPRGAAGG